MATASAIIMHYHQWPAQGKGSNSYVSKTHGLELSRDFSNDVYDWACIPKDSPNAPTWTNAAKAKDEVPKVLLACGIGCNMNYDFGESGALTSDMIESMVDNFSYSVDYKYYYYPDKDSDRSEAWDACRRNVDNKMPVMVSGSSSTGYHAFVLDGYSNNTYYHYNMGWEGANNGWYANGSISNRNYSVCEFFTDIIPQTGRIVLEETLSNGISFTIDDSGLLIISGSGEVPENFASKYLKYHIKECIINEGITSLGANAFVNGLSKITLPASMKSIPFGAIPHSVVEYVVDARNTVFSSPDNVCLYNKETKTLLSYSSAQSEINFPEGVKVIENEAFRDNKHIISVDIPEGVEKIGSEVFAGASNLRELTLPSTLTSIGRSFNKTQLTTLTCKAMYPCSNAIFSGVSSVAEGTLYVPYEAVDRYKNDNSWNLWKEILPIPGSETWKNPYRIDIAMTEAGTLASQLTSWPEYIPELVISGPINSTDIETMRQMCDKHVGKLHRLDLRKARIVVGGENYNNYYKVN